MVVKFYNIQSFESIHRLEERGFKMNPYEVLAVTETTPIIDVHLAYLKKREELAEQQWTLLDVPADASPRDKQTAWLRKLDAVDPRKSDTPPQIDETWSENQRQIEEVEEAYHLLCSQLTPCQIMGITPDATMQQMLEGCGELIRRGASTSAVTQAFTDHFVAIRTAEEREKHQAMRLRGAGSFFGRHQNPHEFEAQERAYANDAYRRKNTYKDESYPLWMRLELANSPR